MPADNDPQLEQSLEQARRAYAVGRPEDAIALLATLESRTLSVVQLHAIAGIHRRFGRQSLANVELRRILSIDPANVEAHFHLATLNDHHTEDDELRALAELAAATTDPTSRIALTFALGKVYDDLGQVERAFAQFESANHLRRAQLDYDAREAAERFAAIKALFTPRLFEQLTGGGNTAERPIFIVGMPRSGSTLTEQILASHPDVFGGGEMRLLADVDKTMRLKGEGTLAGLLETIEPRTLADWAAAYLAPIKSAIRGKRRFTDKRLDNFIRVGLIRLLFPNAKIVHCRRDPLDTCFSIYRRQFAGEGFNYAYDQREIGAYFRLYDDLMDHWDHVLPGFVFRHSYEALIANPEHAMRGLLAFCELDWDPRCLDFFKTERGVATWSATQVRRPLYADGIGAAERYRTHLGPLIDALGQGFTASP